MKDVYIPPAFMVMPKDCGRGAQPVFGGVKCVDTVICHHYCPRQCKEYFDFWKVRKVEKRKRKNGVLRSKAVKPRRQALETVKPRRQALELANDV